MNSKAGKVMVVGGGIAGLTAAWELSRQQIAVELIEKSCFLGGHSIGFTCKATDKCQQCGACSVEQMLSNVVNEPLISIHLRTEVDTCEKQDSFNIVLRKSDADAASGQVLKGFSQHNTPLYVAGAGVDGDVPDGTVNIDTLGTDGELQVDAVVVSTGYTPFDAAIKSTYGYGEWENVITGLEYENIVRENSGIVRPSDGKAPGRIAFIQCVGSRDERLGNLWCSEVCCPYAMRMALGAKYANADCDVSIFYIDIQNAGKEFPVFYEKIKSDIRLVRTIPVDIYPLEEGGLNLRHMEETEGEPASEDFDLVVLSVGIMPGKDTGALSQVFGIPTTADGFLDSESSGTNGVFVAGTAAGPGSIASTMAASGNIAFEAMKYLGVTK